MTRFAFALTLLLVGCSPISPTLNVVSSNPSPETASPAPSNQAIADRWIAPAPTKTTDCHAHDGLPDSECSPGATDPAVTQANIGQTICVSGYSARVRPPVSVTEPIKHMEMLAYGLNDQPEADFEEDHLASIELGGDPVAIANLWPQRWDDQSGQPGAHTKDRLEGRLHALVCSGRILLADAQQSISTDWVNAYRKYVGSLQ